LRKKQTTNGFVGLDIDGAFLAAAQTRNGSVVRAVSAPLDNGLVNEGEVGDPVALGEALKDFFGSEDLPRRVRLGVANQQIVVRQLEMPRISEQSERDAAVRFQTAEAVAMPLEEAVVDYRTVGEVATGDETVKDRIVVVAARRTMLESLLAAVRHAGLKPDGIDLNAFALVRTLAGGTLGDGSARAYCHLGAVTNLAVALGDACLFTRPLSASYGEGSFSDLGEELRLSIEYHLAQPNAPAVGDVVLSGPGAEVEGIADKLSDLVGLPVSVADPLGGRSDELPGEDPYRHTVSLGLALGEAA